MLKVFKKYQLKASTFSAQYLPVLRAVSVEQPWRKLPPFWKKTLKTVFYVLASTAVLLSILLCFALDNTPQTIVLQGMNHDDIQRAKQLLHVTAEEKNSIKTVSFKQKDLNIAASYLLNHFVENTLLIQILPDQILFQIAVFVPENPWGRYLDFHFALRQNGDTIKIKSLKIGEISIPDPAANVIIPYMVRHSALNRHWLAINDYIKSIRITPLTLEVSYMGSIVDTVKQLAISKHKDYPSLHIYQQQINTIVNQHDPAWRLSIKELMQPLFATALQRSNDENAINENRAVIIATASYIYKNELRRYLPLGLSYQKEYPVFAYKRIDIPQNFIASALLPAVDTSLLSQQIGVDKEVGDAQQGSGFSFIDISADRTGIRFGELAVSSPQQARRLQTIMAAIQDYTDFLPDIENLPEHMDEQTFKEKFVNIDNTNYQNMIKLIDQRIGALPLYSQ
jgi:hypothetical protein